MRKYFYSLFIPAMLMIGFGQRCAAQEFFDDFNGTKLNSSLWKKENTKWGENPAKGTHGGVIPENVYVKDEIGRASC